MRVFVILFMAAAISAVAQDEDVLRPNGRPDGSSSSSSSASIPIIFGLEGGLQYNMMSQPMDGFRSSSPFRTFEEGSGLSPYAAIMVDFGVAPTVGIQLRMGWDPKFFENSFDSQQDCIDETTGDVPIATVRSKYSGEISYLNIGASIRWNVTKGLFILAGPVASFSNSTFKETLDEEVLSPEECYFNFGTPQQSKTRSQTIESDTTAQGTRIGLEAGVGYMIDLGSNISLVPRVEYQYMFTPLVKSSGEQLVDSSGAVNFGTAAGTVSDATLNSLRFVLGLWITL